MNAAAAHKNALTILTISDHLFKTGELSADEREKSFNNMMLIALELA
jgi:purine-nucleoside phosphorylase